MTGGDALTVLVALGNSARFDISRMLQQTAAELYFGKAVNADPNLTLQWSGPLVAICDEFEHYGWRRVRAALSQQSLIVNHKKIRRLIRQHDLLPKIRRRFIATTEGRPRVAICGRCLSAISRCQWPCRFNGTARKPVQQCQGGRLREDAEGRGCVSDGVRDICRRRRIPSRFINDDL
ncbi:IS3 family transposase [Devosia sp. A369]